MTIKLTGPLNMNEIDAEFRLGKNLGVHRGVTWYTDTPGQTGVFSATNLGFHDFYGKRKDSPFTIGDSAHFTGGDIQKTFTADDPQRDKWSVSAWVKIEGNGGVVYSGGHRYHGDRLLLGAAPGGINFDRQNVGGPPSAGGPLNDNRWHHLMWTFDNAASPRIHMYVDGVQVGTSDSFDINQGIGKGKEQGVGVSPTEVGYSGFIADMHVVYGSVLTPSSFMAAGKPIAYTGAHGQNGFHLEFKDHANLGKDTSGRGNDWNVNGAVASSTDHP
jgi:hypothetical protein